MNSILTFGNSICSVFTPIYRAIQPVKDVASVTTSTGSLRDRFVQMKDSAQEPSSESPNPMKRTLLFLSSFFTFCYVALPAMHTTASMATKGRFSLQTVSPAACTMISSRILPILGGIACAIDLAVESQQTYHCIRFLRSNPSRQFTLPQELSITQKVLPSLSSAEEQQLQEELTRLKSKYFELTVQEERSLYNTAKTNCGHDNKETSLYLNELRNRVLVNKRYRLIRCVGQPFTDQLESVIPTLQTQLSSLNAKTRQEASSHSQVLLRDMRTQAKKSQIIYVLGIISAAVTLVAVLLTCFSPLAPFIPILISLAGTLFFLMRYIASVELMRTRGWQFSLKDALEHSLIDPIVMLFKKVQEGFHLVSQRL